MACLWLWLSLLCASSFLPSASSEEGVLSPGVSLKCNQSAEVAAENSVTLNCSIYIDKGFSNCEGVEYIWQREGAEESLCDSGSTKYKCDWDGQKYVSLTISNPEAQNYTIYIVYVQATCGVARSSIEVQHKPNSAAFKPPFNGETEPQNLLSTILIAALNIFAVIIVLGILLYFLRRTNREKEEPVHEMIQKTSPSRPLKDFEKLTMSSSALQDLHTADV